MSVEISERPVVRTAADLVQQAPAVRWLSPATCAAEVDVTPRTVARWAKPKALGGLGVFGEAVIFLRFPEVSGKARKKEGEWRIAEHAWREFLATCSVTVEQEGAR